MSAFDNAKPGVVRVPMIQGYFTTLRVADEVFARPHAIDVAVLVPLSQGFTRPDWEDGDKRAKAYEASHNMAVRINKWLRREHDRDCRGTERVWCTVVWWDKEQRDAANTGVRDAEIPQMEEGFVVLWIAADPKSAQRIPLHLASQDILGEMLTADLGFQGEHLRWARFWDSTNIGYLFTIEEEREKTVRVKRVDLQKVEELRRELEARGIRFGTSG